MNTLAIEQSTRTSSVALLDCNGLNEERCWVNGSLRSQAIFTVIPGLLAAAGWSMDEVELLAVGLGPGSSAGVRTALAAAEGLAIVDRKPIVGIGSGDAIAADLATEGRPGPIAVVGDARRQRLWAAVFDTEEPTPRVRVPYTLMTEAELHAALMQVGTVATAEWDRIGEMLGSVVTQATDLVRKPCVPSAAMVGRLAQARYAPRTGTPLPSPIYLHPPVFVDPKYGRAADGP